MAASVYSRTLQKAAELIGGYARLAGRLKVPAHDLQKWVRDEAVPPIEVFLLAVDYILDETPPPAESTPPDPPAPREAGASSRRDPR